jgi:PAS domain S-box-containing protein
MQVLGYKPDELIGQNSPSPNGAWIDSSTERAYLSAVASRRPFAELRYLASSRDGAKKTLSISGRPSFGANNQFLGFRGTATDISDRRQMEEELHRSHDRLVHAQRIGNIGAVEADYLTGESRWSVELCAIMGIDPADAPRTTVKSRELFQSLIHPDDRSKVMALVASNRQGRQTESTDLRIVRPNGEVRWLNREADIKIDADGKPRGGIATYQDITDRKVMEENLRRSRDSLVLAQRVGGVGSTEVDLQTDKSIWSDEMFRIFGIEKSAQPRSFEEYLELLHPDDRDTYRAIRAGDLGGAALDPVEYRIVRPDGEVRWIRDYRGVLRDANGVPTTLIGTQQDITERRGVDEELRHSHESLMAAQRIGQIGSSEVDLISGKAIWSDELFRIMGFDAANGPPSLEAFLQVVHDDDREMVRGARARIGEGISSEPQDFRIARSDGEIRWIHRESEIVRDRTGRPIKLIMVQQDITDREKLRHLVETLSKNVGNLIGEEFLRSLVANMAQALRADLVYIGRFDFDAGTVRTEYVNYLGEFVDNRTFPFRGASCGVVAEGKTLIFTEKAQSPFSDYPNPFGFVVEAYAGTPLYDARGKLFGLLVALSRRSWKGLDYVETVINLYARRAAAEIERVEIEEDARRSRDKMAEVLTALNIARNAIILADDDRRTRYANDVASKILGLPIESEALIGRRLIEFQSDNDEWTEASAAAWSALAAGRQHYATVPWVRPIDGRRIYIDGTISALPTGGYVLVATDATERVRLEEEDRRHREREAQAGKVEALGNLAGGIAHDFNNLLGAVLGFGQFLMQDLAPETEQHRFASRIVGVSERGRSLVRQILAFSRRSPIERTEVRLSEIIVEAYDMLRATLPSTTQIDLENSAEDATVFFDKSQLLQVLVNLCVNASDALDERPGTITVSVTRPARNRPDLLRLPVAESGPSSAGSVTWTDADGTGHILSGGMPRGDCVCLGVADTGSGIPQAMLKKILEPFVTTKEKGKGTGLGLAVVHRIVVDQGGAMVVTTREGGGTRFDIILPLGSSRGDADANGSIATSETARISPRSAAKILVVDDDDAYLSMVETALRRIGHRAEATNDPRVALERLKKKGKKWDVLVTDHTMPYIRGVELIQASKSVSPQTVCIISSAFGSGLNEEQAVAAGADGFLAKPYGVGDLSSLITRLLVHER